MSWLGRIEEACASFIEQTFARVFPSDVEPAHIARKLVSAMEARTIHDGSTMSAPGPYVVYVSKSDYARLAPHREYLESEWAHLLRDVAQRVAIAFDGELSVSLRSSLTIIPGTVDIATGEDEEPAMPSSRTFALRVVKGVPPGAVFRLQDNMTIGRGSQSDIALSDPRISRRHAALTILAGLPVIADLGSTNGTFVDGQRIEGRCRLHTGSSITVGNTTLVVEESKA